MKLLIERTTYKISGAEKYNIDLLKGLSNDTDLVIKFLTNLGPLAQAINRIGIKSHVANWLPEEVGTKKQLVKILLYSPIFICRYIATIRNIEVGKRFNIICLQSRSEMIFLTPVLKLFGYKVIWIQHGPLYITQASRIVKELYTMSAKFVNKIIVVSKDARKDLISGGISSNIIKVLYIGTDTSNLNMLTKSNKTSGRNKLTIPKDLVVIGYLGTVTREKGMADFIEVSRLLSSIDTLKQFYMIIGDGPDRRWMQDKVIELGLSNYYYFTGQVDDVKNYLGLVDILLFPTHHHEGISIAILEAMAMRIPVLATDIGGCREIIKNKYNGFLYKQGDINNMARDIRKLLKQPVMLSTMGKNARQTIQKKYNFEKQIKLFDIFFRSI